MKYVNNQKGQTIIEMLIAIFILIIGVVGIISLVITIRVSTRHIARDFTATNLAREGIEVVRQIRDSNYLEIDNGSSIEWDDGLYYFDGTNYDYTAIPIFVSSASGGSWSLDFPSISAVTGARARIYTNNTSKLYLQFSTVTVPAGHTGTIYYRLLTLNPICYNSATATESIITSGSCTGGTIKIGIHVQCRIRWSDTGRYYNTYVDEKIYDWKY